MHSLNAFVRDFYFFKRSQYPQLSLVHMNPNEAFEKLQNQAFTLQFVELGKVSLSEIQKFQISKLLHFYCIKI
jgi:hypothetical protein